MKIKYTVIVLALVAFVGFWCSTLAQQPFYEAIKTCSSYSKEGVIPFNHENFNLLITLDKKGDKCVYKEKIFQEKKYQMLTCNFRQTQLEPIAKSMKEYYDYYKTQIEKNPIFEGKMTSNGIVFQQYLVDSSICQITHSK